MDPVAELVSRLNGAKKLRIWSVIITFFGDAIVPRGGSVSARTVQLLLARMGIEAGAVRTAFSRLSNDGWVVRERCGRSSFYHLSAAGAEPFEAATDRIYAPLPPPPTGEENWLLTMSNGDSAHPTIVRSGAALQQGSQGLKDQFVLEGHIKHIPDWMKHLKCHPVHQQSFTTLMNAFRPLTGLELSNLDALAVRCLLIHEWRKILFQFESVEPEFWTHDWPQAECHRFVSDLYHQLIPASEKWMEDVATGIQGKLAAPQSKIATRFT